MQTKDIIGDLVKNTMPFPETHYHKKQINQKTFIYTYSYCGILSHNTLSPTFQY